MSASRRDDGQLALDCRFDRSVTGQDLSDLFEGDMRAILAAHGEGRVVDYLLKTIVENREIDLGANPYWQNREGWEESLKKVCDFLRRHVWPHILEMAGGHSADFLLLPSVGCSEMPSAAAAPDALAGGRPISVCIAPSLSILAERMNDAATTVSAQSSLAQAVNPSEDSELPCCTIEARLAAEAFEGQVSPLRGRKATRQRVLDALSGNDVFHFIGHAFVDWKDPLDSGLVCAAQKNEPGVLTVREILQTLGGIQTKVIILSACQIGHVQPGDRLNDFLNLPAALVAAGARTVVAPRWQVDDMATALLISKLITGWIRGGLTIPRALAEARRWLRDDITTDLAVAWIDAALDDPFVDRDALRRLRKRYTEGFEPAEHPFAHERHWGSFEVVGSPTP